MDSLDSVKRRILSRVPLAELVGETVKLEVRSRRPMGKCPFHEDSTPSFVIYDDHYHCFGCKKYGDAIEFVRQSKGVSFFDALRYLAEKYNIEVPELNETSKAFRKRQESASLYTVMRDAQTFYATELWSERGGAARVYLKERGFTDESLKEFGFGLTPREGYGLIKHLRGLGHKEADMYACSLSTQGASDGKKFDFFRSRIMIPIRDPMGRVIAFGGRTTDGHPAKYMNSRETDIFPKSRVLFGLDRAKDAMRKKGRAIIVEGYMDALMLWQRGFPEAVACLGTALTEWHLKLLKPFVGEVCLLFDGDQAGANATLSAVSVALTVPQIAVKAAVLPKGEDPDSFVQKEGPDALEALCDDADDLLDFAISSKLSQTHPLGIPDLVSKEFIPWLAKLTDPFQRSFLIGKVASATGIPREQMEREMATTQRRPVVKAEEPRAAAPVARPPKLDRISYEILGHVFFSQPGDFDPAGLAKAVDQELDLHPLYSDFFHEMMGTLQAGEKPEAALQGHPSLGDEVLALIRRLAENRAAFGTQDRRGRLAKLLKHVKTAKLKESVASLRNQLLRLPKSADAEAEQTRLLSLISEYNQEIKKLETIP